MSLHQFYYASAEPIDAHFEIHEGKLILLSRGGAKGTPFARNTQYAQAFRLLLERISKSALTLAGAWVDSSRVQHLPWQDRQILFPDNLARDPSELFKLLSKRMSRVGQLRKSGIRGNRNKKLRFDFDEETTDEQIIRVVGFGDLGEDLKGRGKISANTLRNVSNDHIWSAVQQLQFESVEHNFGDSTHYHVVDGNGSPWPPKVVFGIAATLALGFDVKPHHFRSGQNEFSHKAIKSAGFPIIRKLKSVNSDNLPISDEDRTWCEGKPKRVQHLQRERRSGISGKKKAEFKRNHGRLYCERCGLDPIEKYGVQNGEACIEVHHTIPLAEMPEGYETKLSDLKCLCANCHRIEHSELRNTG